MIYPASWTVAISPYANEAERRAEGWLREKGVIHDSATEEKFVKLSVAEYANWPFPFAVLEKRKSSPNF